MSIKNWNVLVVEDEADSQEVVQSILQISGIRSTGVPTAENALEVLEDVQPTLIVIDLALPGLNGWQLIERVRADPSVQHLPCVAITAYHSAEVAQQAIAAGFNAYFSKPIDATSFVRELEIIVEGE